mgnify:CR=1 FL=1
MRPRDESKRVAIAEAAIELITALGFSNTSMAKIAEAAGVSPATIYLYFENREDLINKLYLLVKREISASLLLGCDASYGAEENFRTIWNNIRRVMMEHKVKYLFSEQFTNSPWINKVSQEEVRSYFLPLRELYEMGRAREVFKDLPFEVFIAIGYAPLMWLVKMSYNGCYELTDEMLRVCYETSWKAVTR